MSLVPAFTSSQIPIQQLSSPAQTPPKLHNLGLKSSHYSHENGSLDASTASWTSSIAYYCKNGSLPKAVSEFNRMRLSGVEPNHITFVTLLSGCANFPSHGLYLGPSVHGYCRKLGLDFNDVMVGTALIGMYSKFGKLGISRMVFDHLVIRNKVTWNTLINGYMRDGEFEMAINLFDEMSDRDAVSWTVLIDGFLKKGKFEEALECFQEMQRSGVAPDFVTIISVLSAVSNLGTLGLGLWLHRFVLMHDLKDNMRVNNTLIDMYCRCGSVELARQVFDSMARRSLVSWNSIIVGLAVNAHAEAALKYFKDMQIDGFIPDGVSYTGSLTACSHAGLVNEGLELFDKMTQLHKITPTVEHYGCIVDLYSRAGRLKEALLVIQNMPMKPNKIMLGSLLAACRACNDVDLAENLMKYIYDLDPKGDSNYVMLSNIYAATGSWHGASKVRKKMKAFGVLKKPGISSIEINGVVNDFVSGDKSHVDADRIYAVLEWLTYELTVSEHILEDHNMELLRFD
ncbi:pentatricopeptide repeat-containing protein chloroplastic-like [Dorcoceras hygrometricum]|uniref:Pentatricopeptide repeat-containing protein chloroplastic-like n=1 Tax=Dorcoceras hygrometricum TaxID=472368 RepID=A0A2Z7A7C4_9LAMI|nr:pentatricopeptide repeat-containing protein chloroplastic-like [Dorcoceras hygrometricum]